MISYFLLSLFSDKVLRGNLIFYTNYKLNILFFGTIFYILFAYAMELYDIKKYMRFKTLFFRTILFGIIFSIIVYFSTLLFINTTVSRFYLILFLSSCLLLISFIRILCNKILIKNDITKSFVLYIYDNDYTKEVLDNQKNKIKGQKGHSNYKIKLSIDNNNARFSNQVFINACKKIDLIIIDVPIKQISKKVQNFLFNFILKRKNVLYMSQFIEDTLERISIFHPAKRLDFLVNINQAQKDLLFSFFNWSVNLFIVVIMGFSFTLLAPFIFIINLFFNKGPLLYSQLRVGKNNKEFKVYKFRSMVEDAEKNGEQMAIKNDARVTLFGRLMRKYRIDEIPQFLSIAQGNMSFIGPRPERKMFVDKINEINQYYDIRHIIKPGLTGWAQVCYKYGENIEDSLRKLEYDLYYIKHRSIGLTIRILFKTITAVLFSRGM